MELHDRFEAVNEEYGKFCNVENKLSTRPDIHAFILLNEIFPYSRDMVCAASHDVIYLEPDCDQIGKLTDEQILDLVRCGVMHDEENESLMMFV
jgi:hypothetical protein